MPYIKLDNNFADSSLLADGGFERSGVFFYLCSKADIHGWVTVSVPTIAKAGGIALEKAEAHLEALAGPDPYSRTPTDEGRRIRIQREPEWGIQIVNYAAYRNKDHTGAARQRRFRERQKRAVTVKRVTSHKTEDRGQRTVGEPTVPLTPPSSVKGRFAQKTETELLARQYIHLFNWCTGRSCQATSEVVRKIQAALKAGTKPDEILCFPFIHTELNKRRREQRTIEPSWLLRDGSRNTHNWIAEALDKADGLELSAHLSNIASAQRMTEKLKALGAKVNPTKELLNGQDP
jgi:hypothetical protein